MSLYVESSNEKHEKLWFNFKLDLLMQVDSIYKKLKSLILYALLLFFKRMYFLTI